MPHLTLGCTERRAQALEHSSRDTDKTTETSKVGRRRSVRLRCRIPVSTMEAKSAVKRVRSRMPFTGVMFEVKYMIRVCRLE